MILLYTRGNRRCFQFVLTATGSEAEQVISSQGTKWEGAGLGKLPIFNAANNLS